MSNFRYTLIASALLAVSAAFFVGCNFPEVPEDNDTQTTLPVEENSTQDNSMQDDSSQEDSMKDSESAEDESTTTTTTNNESTDEPETTEEAMEDTEAMTQKAAPQFVAFNQSAYEADLGKKPVALFFHADWCPTCLKMEKDINAEISSFPAGTKIYKVNYDTEKALKDKYGINSQSTIVIIDKNGKATKTLAAPSNSKLISAINETL